MLFCLQRSNFLQIKLYQLQYFTFLLSVSQLEHTNCRETNQAILTYTTTISKEEPSRTLDSILFFSKGSTLIENFLYITALHHMLSFLLHRNICCQDSVVLTCQSLPLGTNLGDLGVVAYLYCYSDYNSLWMRASVTFLKCKTVNKGLSTCVMSGCISQSFPIGRTTAVLIPQSIALKLDLPVSRLNGSFAV